MQLPLAIQHLDLTAELDRLVTKDGFSREAALAAENEYRRFLALCTKCEGLTPSEDMDAVWHQHMADTRKYMTDCNAIFGCFLHHDPNVTGNLMDRQFSRTSALYLQEFGEPLGGAAYQCGSSKQPEECGMVKAAACGNSKAANCGMTRQPAACGMVHGSPASCGCTKAA